MVTGFELCPFFSAVSGTKIICEGVEKDNWTNVSWKEKKPMHSYRQKHCCKDYETCLVYQMLMTKYPD